MGDWCVYCMLWRQKTAWWEELFMWNALLGGAPGCPGDDLSCRLEVSTSGKGGPESHFDPSSNSVEQTSWSLAPRPSLRGSSVFINSCMSLPWRTNKQLNLTHPLHQLCLILLLRFARKNSSDPVEIREAVVIGHIHIPILSPHITLILLEGAEN